MTHRLDVSSFAVTYPHFRLTPLSFTVSSGERVALVGPNGSGKTTTMRALAAHIDGYEGSVQLDGAELRAAGPGVRARIGFMPDDLAGFGWMSVRQHLDFLRPFYPGWDPVHAVELLRRLGLAEEFRLGALSRGMRAKLSFVCAEAFRPPVLLLDEPTSGLDPLVRMELIRLLQETAGPESGRIVIFSTHVLEDVETVATRILVLQNGRLITDRQMADFQRDANGTPVHRALYEVLEQHAQ